MTNSIRPISFALFLSALLLLGCAKKLSPELEQGLALYNKNELKEALPYLERAVELDTKDAEAHALLAETYRRLGDMEKSVAVARKAIDLDPCNSFAHTVLADVYNPQYGSWKETNSDTTWSHLLKAVDCDPSEGGAWMGIWSESMRRGEKEWTLKALNALVKTEFLTRAALAYNRWMLSHLPENALLIVNGDLDTYPAVALQEVNQFRRDVAIVNTSLLNMTGYARFIRDHYGIPLPFEDARLDSLTYFKDERGTLVTPASQIFKGWVDLKGRGKFPHPIAVSMTVDESFYSNIVDHLKLEGAYLLWYSELGGAHYDTTAIRTSLESINPDDFKGSFVSPQDRSPIRRTFNNDIVRNVTWIALYYGDALIKAGRFAEAQKMLTWAEEFEKKTVKGPVFTEAIARLKEAASGQKK